MSFRDKEKCKEYQRNYQRIRYHSNVKYHEYYKIKSQKTYEKNRKEISSKRNELKLKVFEKLGNKCANPYNINHGDLLSDVRCLQIDHVYGHGLQMDGKWRGVKFLYKVLTDTENNYQLLCACCNWIKRYENNEGHK